MIDLHKFTDKEEEYEELKIQLLLLGCTKTTDPYGDPIIIPANTRASLVSSGLIHQDFGSKYPNKVNSTLIKKLFS